MSNHDNSSPYDKDWTEIDPRRYPYSEQLVLAALEEGFQRWRDEKQHATKKWERQYRGVEIINRVLIDKLGPWVAGWQMFGHGEGSIGALSQHWCCVGHDFPGKPKEPSSIYHRQDVDKIAATIGDVRTGFLELANQLDRLAESIKERCDEEKMVAIRKEVPSLVSWVVKITEGNDMWYHFLSLVLLWAVDVCQIRRADIGPQLSELISAHFESWIAPDESSESKFNQELIAELEKSYSSK